MTETAHLLPSYDDVMLELHHAKASQDAAELHGMLCGMICAHVPMDRFWLRAMLDEPNEVLENSATIEQLFNASCQALGDVTFDFQLLLPDDDEKVSVRLQSLALWCQGLLTGLVLSGIELAEWDEGEMHDAIRDLAAIAEADYSTAEDSEDDEKAIFEISEYVRMATLMIYCEIAAKEKTVSANQPGSDVLH